MPFRLACNVENVRVGTIIRRLRPGPCAHHLVELRNTACAFHYSALSIELAQALAQQTEGFLDALDPLGGPVEAVVFEVAAEVSHHLAEAAEAFGGYKRNDRLRVLLDLARVEQLVDRPGGHADVVQRLAKLAQRSPVRQRPRLKVLVQSPQFSGNATQLGRKGS